MSDPKRANLITVGAPKSAKNNVTKTVRLTINLDESNESKYPELNYKELVIVEEKKKTVENGKTPGLDPFSDGDDDVERVARKFEQKYGGKNTYGKKKKKKRDEFADIGAGYDENDSFIDNTDGYDEMIPPECDTFYGGFYINSGSLEFKTVPEDQMPVSDGEGNRRNKRRISSSSSEVESSESSSESSRDVKDSKDPPNGAIDSHNTEHRKKKNKKIDKKKAKRIRRTDSSAATSGKQTSDDNNHGNEESVDSRTSQSDSLTSKPAPSSENVLTSDSSRDAGDIKLESLLPSPVKLMLEDMKIQVARLQLSDAGTKIIDSIVEPLLIKMDRSLSSCEQRVQKCAWARVARTLNTTRAKLCHRVKNLVHNNTATAAQPQQPTANITQTAPTSHATTTANNKRKQAEQDLEDLAIDRLTPQEREAKIVETLARLQALIEEKRPGMIANYNAECERVQEERKKLQIATPDGAPHVEKRLPKRRFPWCVLSRSLLARVSRLAGDQHSAASLLANRVLPMFPKGFVRMPTLLRQADLKTGGEVKRQRVTSSSQPPPQTQTNIVQSFTEPITFPSSLTVTTTTKADKTDTYVDDVESKIKQNNIHASKNAFESQFGKILNSYTINNKELSIEKEDRSKIKETDKEKDKYLPPNSIGSITITPVNNAHKTEKTNPSKSTTNTTSYEKQKEPLIRVKTPATLMKEANEIAIKEKDRHKPKHTEKNHSHSKEKRVQSPLLIETNFQPKEKANNPSPNPKKDEISHKQIETLRSVEDKIPRPALIPVQHSPTFVKPDKRPPDSKKKKEIVIISDVDPLSDMNNEPQVVDDSSSDVEVIEDKNTEKSEVNKPNSDANKPTSDVNRQKSETVPSTDNSVIQVNHKKEIKQVKERDKHKEKAVERKGEKMDTDDTEADIDTVMKSLRDLQDSQEPSNFNSNSYGGVITSAKHVRSGNVADVARTQKDKLAERSSLNKMDGCSSSEVDVA